MTKYKFLVLAFLPFCLFADCADCQAYKSQVVSDCNALDSSLQSVANNVSSASGFATSGYNSSTDPNDKAIFSTIISTLSNTQGYIDSVSSFVSSIRYTAQSLQCNVSSNTVGSCDCAQYLQTLIGLVQTCNQTVSGISSGLDSVKSVLGSPSPDLNSIIVTLNNTELYIADLSFIIASFFEWDDGSGDVPLTISDFYLPLSEIGNSLTNYSDRQLFNYPSSRMATFNSGSVGFTTYSQSTFWYPFFNSSDLRSSSLNTVIKRGFATLVKTTGSLNNYLYTNTLAIASIAQKMDMLTNTVDISSITNLLEEKFTIFNPSSPLEIYTQGSEQNYYQFLTNYYIKVSTGGTLSPSEPHTNWFSRIEMLLASLVFKDDGTNFVDNAKNTGELENTLSQSVDTLSQAVSVPQNVTGKIDNMGQSFLGLLGEWRDIVSGNSLPSQFVLCDINLSSQNRDSSSDSSVSSFRLETSLDSGEFRQFLDFCHAITTILFTMLFVWLSIMLLSFLLTSLAKLAQFCYLVYSALFGG